ncbi:patatin-like protein 6 [Aegilops tauschii subsp. strangulata]|uniref:Patatin n=1 Tax=Aegilops tauschii subsp. strangulata TaxID=200361 RepID=A0A453IHL3_AEGTS|nr:patatin-like protein 6 [Aegilops tauschii subsp. strangulata]
MEEAEEMQVERVHEDAEHGGADADKLNYEIFSILESKFLFGYTDPHQLWLPKPPPPEQASAAMAVPGKAAQRGKVCVLCVDGGGGGLRALLAGRALAHLEAALQRASGSLDARVADFFDLAAGTGAGGVFAAMLFSTHSRGAPLFRAEDTWRLVADHAPRLFRRPAGSTSLFCRAKKRPLAAPTAALSAAMKAAFGEELTLRDTIKPVLISCYDLKSSAPLLFSRADALESGSYDFRLSDVGRAAWSEPGRFEPAEVASVDGVTSCAAVDGGPTMGSPAAAAITHVLHNKHEFPFVRGVEDLLVLSIGGCSGAGGSGATADADIMRMRRWGPKEWARPIARIAADGAADLVDHAVARAFGQCHSSNYLRIQAKRESMPPCGPDGEYDPTQANVQALLAAADETMKQRNVESVLFEGRRIGEQTNAEKLEWFAAELVAEHRGRGSRIAPTVAFKQSPALG